MVRNSYCIHVTIPNDSLVTRSLVWYWSTRISSFLRQDLYYTEKKKIKFYSYIYKGIQSGAVVKSCMRKGFLIYEKMLKYFPIYEESVSDTVYDFATAPFWISLYMRKFYFLFNQCTNICVFRWPGQVAQACLRGAGGDPRRRGTSQEKLKRRIHLSHTGHPQRKGNLLFFPR